MRTNLNSALIMLTLIALGLSGILLKDVYQNLNLQLNQKVELISDAQTQLEVKLLMISQKEKMWSDKWENLSASIEKMKDESNLLLHNIEKLETANCSEREKYFEMSIELENRLFTVQNTITSMKLHQNDILSEIQSNLDQVKKVSDSNDTLFQDFLIEHGTRKMKKNFYPAKMDQKQILFSER